MKWTTSILSLGLALAGSSSSLAVEPEPSCPATRTELYQTLDRFFPAQSPLRTGSLPARLNRATAWIDRCRGGNNQAIEQALPGCFERLFKFKRYLQLTASPPDHGYGWDISDQKYEEILFKKKNEVTRVPAELLTPELDLLLSKYETIDQAVIYLRERLKGRYPGARIVRYPSLVGGHTDSDNSARLLVMLPSAEIDRYFALGIPDSPGMEPSRTLGLFAVDKRERPQTGYIVDYFRKVDPKTGGAIVRAHEPGALDAQGRPGMNNERCMNCHNGLIPIFPEQVEANPKVPWTAGPDAYWKKYVEEGKAAGLDYPQELEAVNERIRNAGTIDFSYAMDPKFQGPPVGSGDPSSRSPKLLRECVDFQFPLLSPAAKDEKAQRIHSLMNCAQCHSGTYGVGVTHQPVLRITSFGRPRVKYITTDPEAQIPGMTFIGRHLRSIPQWLQTAGVPKSDSRWKTVMPFGQTDLDTQTAIALERCLEMEFTGGGINDSHPSGEPGLLET